MNPIGRVRTRARSEGVPYEHAIGGYLAEFQAAATSSQSLSELEMAVVKIISQQTDVMQKKLEYHWQNFNPIQQSALPLQALATDSWLKGTKPKDARRLGLPITSHLWGQAILSRTDPRISRLRAICGLV